MELNLTIAEVLSTELPYDDAYVNTEVFWKTSWFILIEAAVIVSVGILVAFRISKENNRRKNYEYTTNKEKTELEIMALRSQMNPHFIFNTFNSIQYLIHTHQNSKAEYFLEKFSKLLRRVVDQTNQKLTSLAQEIDMIRVYIDLQNLRFNDKFKFNLHLSDEIELDRILIPGMIIQPFIENAIEHGLSKKDGLGTIDFSIELQHGLALIIIKDNGIGRNNAIFSNIENHPYKSIGIKNVERRIELLNLGAKSENTIIVSDLVDKEKLPIGTSVNITIRYGKPDFIESHTR